MMQVKVKKGDDIKSEKVNERKENKFRISKNLKASNIEERCDFLATRTRTMHGCFFGTRTMLGYFVGQGKANLPPHGLTKLCAVLFESNALLIQIVCFVHKEFDLFSTFQNLSRTNMIQLLSPALTMTARTIIAKIFG